MSDGHQPRKPAPGAHRTNTSQREERFHEVVQLHPYNFIVSSRA